MRKLIGLLLITLVCIIIFSAFSKKENTQGEQETKNTLPVITRPEHKGGSTLGIRTKDKVIQKKTTQEKNEAFSDTKEGAHEEKTITQTDIVIEELHPTTQESAKIPTSVNLELIFFPQAPDANWDLPRQEACEEASIVLAAYYINQNILTKNQMRSDILGLVQRQKANFGDYIHTTAQQTVEMYNGFYGEGTAKIIENPSIDDIKNELTQGHVLVAPFAGRLLGNPHYSGIGPRYHMMVIKGYDDVYFYTHDVGTVHGENFRYTYQTILNANHDYNDGDISQGRKRMIVLQR